MLGTAEIGETTGFGLFRLPIELGGYVPVLMGDRGKFDFWPRSAEDESDGRRPIMPFGPLPV